ncbi:MAG: hypothetical protein AB1295_06235 [Candidatus Micrarchaeota archaeon]
MVDVSGYLQGFNSDSSLGGVYSALPEDLQFLPMTMLAVVTIAIIYGTVTALGRAFNVSEVERFAQAELLNALATVFMVSFLILMLNGVEDFALQYFICGGGECPAFDCGGSSITIDRLSNSVDLLKCRIADKAAAFAAIQEQVTDAAAVPLNMLNLYISLLGVPIFTGQYVASWYKDAETYRLLNNVLTVMLIGLNALIVVADYVKNNMLSFFLPIGLLLRSLFFTRGIGAFLIAVAIGFYFIFPVVYIITDPGFVKPTYVAPAKPPEYQSPLCIPTFNGLSYSIYSTYGSKATSASAATTLSLDQLKSDITSVYSSVLLQPFIAFAITIVIVRYMIIVLGGESMDVLRAVAKVV